MIQFGFIIYAILVIGMEFILPFVRILLCISFIHGADLVTKFFHLVERHDSKIKKYFRGKVCWITGMSINAL